VRGLAGRAPAVIRGVAILLRMAPLDMHAGTESQWRVAPAFGAIHRTLGGANMASLTLTGYDVRQNKATPANLNRLSPRKYGKTADCLSRAAQANVTRRDYVNWPH
jgi:hypothetical protein